MNVTIGTTCCDAKLTTKTINAFFFVTVGRIQANPDHAVLTG
ncbi:hypothetical protein [Candidatus Sororendozoicomonas aggregata]